MSRVRRTIDPNHEFTIHILLDAERRLLEDCTEVFVSITLNLYTFCPGYDPIMHKEIYYDIIQ